MNGPYEGVLLGTAIGDALGAPVEGSPTVPVEYLDSLDTDPPRRYTDDGAMTLGVARSLVEQRGFDGEHMAATLADLFYEEPWRGYGAGPPQIFSSLRSGAAWNEPAARLFGGSGSFGNGAAMRVAPVALFGHPDLDLAAHIAHQSALITHSHPEGIDGAVAQALAIDRVLSDITDPSQLVEDILPYMRTDVFQERLERIPVVVASNEPPSVSLGSGIAACDSVATAIACALGGHTFRSVIRSAVGGGGDTDTVAAMAGAVAGARFGRSGIPEAWRSVEAADRFIDLADRLSEISESR